MKNLFKSALASFLLCTFSASMAYGYSVGIVENTDTVHYAKSISEYSTTGADMVGMEVTVYFASDDEDDETVTWTAYSTTGGEVVGNGWEMYIGGDTYDYGWVFNNLTGRDIIGFSLNGISGNTAFDLTFEGASGTTNSALGLDFDVDSSGTGYIEATYSGALSLIGSSPVGDLYTSLTVMFYDNSEDKNSIVLSGLRFKQDTDNSVGEIDPTPEPISMLLFGTGIAGLVGTRLRRKRN